MMPATSVPMAERSRSSPKHSRTATEATRVGEVFRIDAQASRRRFATNWSTASTKTEARP
jgi:hypothetical protein